MASSGEASLRSGAYLHSSVCSVGTQRRGCCGAQPGRFTRSLLWVPPSGARAVQLYVGGSSWASSYYSLRWTSLAQGPPLEKFRVVLVLTFMVLQ